MRRGVVAVLAIKDWGADAKPSDEDLKNIYDAHKSEFTIPEERSVQFVAVADEAKAHEVAESARGGMKLGDAASKATGAPAAVKTMENVKSGTLPAELDKAIFKLPRGETSEPVNTPLGWYVMQITNIKASAVVPMARIQDKLIESWRQDRATDQLPKLLNKIDDGIAGGSSLEEIAKTYHLQLHQLPLSDEQGRGLDANTSADKNTKEILAAEFKQNQGEVGNVFETSGGDYAVLRVDELKPAAVPPLKDIHDQVVADWKKANQRQLAEDTARKLANDWRKGDNVTDEAKKIGAALTVHNGLSRADAEKTQKPAAGIDRAILQAAATGEVVTSADANVEYVAKIRAIAPPPAADITDAVLGDMRNAASQWVKNDYVQLFLNALEKRYTVEINDKAVKQVESSAN
jgi:peptidyl-prolyl cis-trans isomerase D